MTTTTDTKTVAKINRMARTVDAWHTPPECQGQAVQYSYGTSEDGTQMARRIDRSGPETSYCIMDLEAAEDWSPWSVAPEGAYGAWAAES